MLNPEPPTFESVVLAGGGNRCFWHAGFWREVQGPLALAPRQIAAVSAAGAIACAITAGKGDEALRLFQAATRANPRNCYPRNLFGKDPVFPHERMYRAAMLDLFDPPTLAKVHAGPDIRVLLGHMPPWLGPRTGFLAASAAYNFDKRVRRVVHPTTARAIGYRPRGGVGARLRHAGDAGRSHPRVIVFPADDVVAQMERAVRARRGRCRQRAGVRARRGPRGDAGDADAPVCGAAGHPRAHLCPAVGEDPGGRLGLHEPGGDSVRVRPGSARRRGVRERPRSGEHHTGSKTTRSGSFPSSRAK